MAVESRPDIYFMFYGMNYKGTLNESEGIKLKPRFFESLNEKKCLFKNFLGFISNENRTCGSRFFLPLKDVTCSPFGTLRRLSVRLIKEPSRSVLLPAQYDHRCQIMDLLIKSIY